MSARSQAAPAAHTASPRPFATYYYGEGAREGQWSRIGRASTRNGAIRAALRHLLEGTAASAVIYDESQAFVARLHRQGGVIRIVGVI